MRHPAPGLFLPRLGHPWQLCLCPLYRPFHFLKLLTFERISSLQKTCRNSTKNPQCPPSPHYLVTLYSKRVPPGVVTEGRPASSRKDLLTSIFLKIPPPEGPPRLPLCDVASGRQPRIPHLVPPSKSPDGHCSLFCRGRFQSLDGDAVCRVPSAQPRFSCGNLLELVVHCVNLDSTSPPLSRSHFAFTDVSRLNRL